MLARASFIYGYISTAYFAQRKNVQLSLISGESHVQRVLPSTYRTKGRIEGRREGDHRSSPCGTIGRLHIYFHRRSVPRTSALFFEASVQVIRADEAQKLRVGTVITHLRLSKYAVSLNLFLSLLLIWIRTASS